jgi:thiol:disulfide interchange protein DsbD
MGLSASGLYLGWFEASQGSSAFRIFRRLIGIALLASAVISAVWIPKMDSLIEWRPYSMDVIEEAVRENKPVLVDVYADWCVPCVEMDMTTFRDARVADMLSQMVPIRIDATGSVTPDQEAFFDEYGVFGVPTMLFFDSNGKEKESLRVSGYISPDELLGRLSVFGFIYKDETGGG